MLTIHHLTKSHNLEIILSDITLNLGNRERMGVVGPNGSGKTTLLRILIGELLPDAGNIHFNPPDLRIGYLPQGFEPNTTDTLESFLMYEETSLPTLVREIEKLAAALVNSPKEQSIQDGYDRALRQFHTISERSKRLPEILAIFGLDKLPLSTSIGNLSGGQKTRLALARILLNESDLLLLDEPTNHLDIDMLAWLESWLISFPGAAIIVSHDRFFLDRSCNAILEIDPITHQGCQYTGNYTAYLEAKLIEREHQTQEYKDQLEEISRLHAAISRIRENSHFTKGGKGDTGDKFARGFFANRAKRTIRRGKQLEKRLEYLITDGKIEKPRQDRQIKIEFDDVRVSGRDVLTLEEVAIGYNEKPLLEGINAWLRFGARTVLLGPNGCGKTTLLRTIAGRLSPLAGRVHLGANVKVGYMTQEQENLDPTITAFETILSLASFSETETRTFLHRFLFSGEDVFIPVGNLSYGERARLMLATLVVTNCNLLLLDEPINHLDIPSRNRFEQALAAYEGTILAVVHDRYFIHNFAKHIWEIQRGKLMHHYC